MRLHNTPKFVACSVIAKEHEDISVHESRPLLMLFEIAKTDLTLADLLDRLEDRERFVFKEAACEGGKAHFKIAIPIQSDWRDVVKEIDTIFGVTSKT